ncbi:GNAT family N-acetyltransferase [Paenibacillus sp. alder61]|uniref:GNAT family N-acetyltransferase n=1 Tax=Paenibacillus faecis TaxID=862114 RepID=A0A5D0CUL6_9BACL|nr:MULTISPECIES: GNAT family N-acetyltransferase [Paenibacillus]MCA1292042.1 GNAT family N-acetyltransferase [Paenibacillus sp. alder61]TYA13613.1 GNAT family N-acetyltransferase [Paenibacillus faecis]
MSAKLMIVQASLGDLQDVAELFNQYRVFYGQASDPAGAEAFLFQLMEHRESVILLARVENGRQPVGFVQLYPTYSSISMQRSWVLNDLFVPEKWRKQGIGRKLLDAAADMARLTKAKGLALETAPDNLSAQKLYESLGYVRDTEFFHYYLTL